jgi:urea-proton symporter
MYSMLSQNHPTKACLAGATIQVLLFAMVGFHALAVLSTNTLLLQLAAKLKLNAPYAHTWLEIVGVRWGKVAHFVFMFFG